MNRAELKRRIDAGIDDLIGITSRLRDLPETPRVVRVMTRVEAAIDDLRVARAATTIAAELD